MLVQEEKVFQMFGKMGELVGNQLLQADRLVDRTADHVDHDPFRGKAFILFAEPQGRFEEIDNPLGIGPVDNGEG